MWFAAAWISPGILILISYIYRWYRGEDITKGMLKIALMFCSLGIFIPMVEKKILDQLENRSTKVLIKGRKQK